MYTEADKLPNFKFSRRMCTSLISQSQFANQIGFYKTSCFGNCLNNRRCQSLDSLIVKRKIKTGCIYGDGFRKNICQERFLTFDKVSSSDSALDSDLQFNQFANGQEIRDCDDDDDDDDHNVMITNREVTLVDSMNEFDVPMPYSLQKIFANPSKHQSNIEPSLIAQNGNYLESFPPQVMDKNILTPRNTIYSQANPMPSMYTRNTENISTMSSSCNSPSLLSDDNCSQSDIDGTLQSSQRERRILNSSDCPWTPPSNASQFTVSNSPRESWYYYDLRMRPTQQSFQVDNIADTLLEFFRQFQGPVEHIPPLSYDRAVAVDVTSSNTSSSILVPVEGFLDLFPEERDSLPLIPYDLGYNCSPPPYSEHDEPPAYEEIDERGYQNIYEIVNSLDSDATVDSQCANQSDLAREPLFDPRSEASSGFNFCLSGRPAVRWNVQSGVERWATAPCLRWNES